MKEDDNKTESGARSYWSESRRLSMGILLLLPLAAIYQVGIVESGSEVRNLAELWLTQFISAAGVPAAHLVNGLLIGTIVMALFKLDRDGSVCGWFLVIMAMEGILYAAGMFRGLNLAATTAHHYLTEVLTVGDLGRTSVLVAVGAGVYEEIVFRLLLLGGGAALLHYVFQWNRAACMCLMLLVSSGLFSLAHYVGMFGESPSMFTFLFRGLAGLVLGTIYILRGVGIAAWTHAGYNVMVLLAG